MPPRSRPAPERPPVDVARRRVHHPGPEPRRNRRVILWHDEGAIMVEEGADVQHLIGRDPFLGRQFAHKLGGIADVALQNEVWSGGQRFARRLQRLEVVVNAHHRHGAVVEMLAAQCAGADHLINAS